MKMHIYWLCVILSLLISLSVQADQDSKDTASEDALEERDEEATELYVIYAKDVSIKSQADAINELLATLVSDKSAIYASEVNRKVGGEDMWTLFWGVPLTASQAEKVKADPNVSESLVVADTLHYVAVGEMPCITPTPIAKHVESSRRIYQICRLELSINRAQNMILL